MPSSTQRIANQYPDWSKLRSDPSSVGQRFFSTFSEYFDFLIAERIKIRQEFYLLKHGLGFGEVYVVDLEGDDEFSFSATSTNTAMPVYHSEVSASIDEATSVVLSRDETIEDLLYGFPTRTTLEETILIPNLTIWESTTPLIFNELAFPERLTVVVSDSTEYLIQRTTKNTLVSNRSFVQIAGVDLNGIPVKETIQIPDDGAYLTRHIYSDVSSVEFEGFDGTVSLLLTNTEIPFKVDPFMFLATQDIEGPSWLQLVNETVYTLDCSFLLYRTPILKLGSEYRNGTDVVDNIEILSETLLLDSLNAPYQAVDIAVSPNNTLLYVIDSLGWLRVYRHGITSFTPPTQAATVSSSISLLPLVSYAKYGQSIPIWTWFRQPRGNIITVMISRIKPDSTVEYLQADKTWSATSYSFSGINNPVIPEESWQDIKFFNEYDQVGQWEFYCTVTTSLNSETTVSQTSVMCDSLVPLVELETGVVSPTGLYFNHESKLVITTALDANIFIEHRDTYLADIENQAIVLREQYLDVTVVP